MPNLSERQQTHPRLGVVTIHDACPAFSTKIFKSADELERLNIKYNIALVPFFNEKQDLPRVPELVFILLRSSLSWDYYCLVAQIVMDNQIFCLLRLPLDNKLLR